jgi:hypothetical protein
MRIIIPNNSIFVQHYHMSQRKPLRIQHVEENCAEEIKTLQDVKALLLRASWGRS